MFMHFFPNVYFLADQKHHHAYLYFPKTLFPNSQAAHPETMEVQKLDAAEVPSGWKSGPS